MANGLNKILMVILSLIIISCGSKANTTKQVDVPKAEASIASGSQLTNSCNNIGGPNFVNLVKTVAPTVVNISSEISSKNKANQNFPGLDPNDPFYELFKHFMPQMPKNPISKSYGSGFIISQDGYLLTNAHVVKDATKITVTTNDNHQYTAKLIGLDEKTDIGVLKIDAKNLTKVAIGDPSQLQVGEWVVAIGAPFGLENTITAGIVSAKGRSLPGDGYVPFIQTDVAINPGNSGGPLFNTNAQVVGINSQIYSRSGGFMGISFTIPIDIAMQVFEQIRKTGHAEHAVLGVMVQKITPELAKSFDLKNENGALIANVVPNSAASKAGLLAGDVILKVDDKEITASTDLPLMIGSKKPGDKVSLLVLSNGKIKSLKVTLGGDTSSAKDHTTNSKSSQPKTTSIKDFGLEVANINDSQFASQLKDKTGVVVVDANGLAASAGIMPGDLILMVNSHKIKTVDDLEASLKNQSQAALLIERDGSQVFIGLSK